MRIDDYERMCRAAGLRPELRGQAEGYDVFIADGFSAVPWRDFRKFGGTREEFPGGAYGTMWLLAKGEERVVGGGMCLFDIFHDPGCNHHEKRQMRLNTAKAKIEDYLETRRRVNGTK